MRIEVFKPYHVDLLRAQGVQDAQITEVSIVPASYAQMARPEGPAVTAFEADRIMICGGIAKISANHGVCWALMSPEAGRHMLFMHRAVQRFITSQPWKRLEATVAEGFTPGCRWVEMLGFKFEGPMPFYGPAGETHLRYGRYG
jgi:hypothetical protein